MSERALQTLEGDRLALYNCISAMANIKGIYLSNHHRNGLIKCCDKANGSLVASMQEVSMNSLFIPAHNVLNCQPNSNSISQMVLSQRALVEIKPSHEKSRKRHRNTTPKRSSSLDQLSRSNSIENDSNDWKSINEASKFCKQLSNSSTDSRNESPVFDTLSSVFLENDEKVTSNRVRKRPRRTSLARSFSVNYERTPVESNNNKRSSQSDSWQIQRSRSHDKPTRAPKLRPKRSCTLERQNSYKFRCVTPQTRFPPDQASRRRLFAKPAEQLDNLSQLYQCHYCSFGFLCEYDLHKHVRNIHGFVCSLCPKPKPFKKSVDCFVHWKTEHLPYFLLRDKDPEKDYARPLLLSTCVSWLFHGLVDSVLSPSQAKLPNLEKQDMYKLSHSVSVDSLSNLHMFKLPTPNMIAQWKRDIAKEIFHLSTSFDDTDLELQSGAITFNEFADFLFDDDQGTSEFLDVSEQSIQMLANKMPEPAAASTPVQQMVEGALDSTAPFVVSHDQSVIGDMPSDLIDVFPMQESIDSSLLQKYVADLTLSDLSQYL